MEEVEHKIDNKIIIEETQKMTASGWIKGNLTLQMFQYSDFVKEKLNLSTNSLTFKELFELTHPEDRDRLEQGMELLTTIGMVDTNLRVLKNQQEFVSMRVRLGRPKKEDEQLVVYGITHFLSVKEDAFVTWEMMNGRSRELKYWQEHVPRMLTSVLERRDFDEVVNETLTAILNRFRADRAYLFQYDRSKGTQSCTHEKVRKGVSAEIDFLQNLSISVTPWWNSYLERHELISIDLVDEMPEAASSEQAFLTEQGIMSLMAMPMIDREGVWGFLGVDMTRERHTWTEGEQNWFMVVCNIVSLCLKLYRANEDLHKEKEYLRYIENHIPVGIEVFDAEGYLQACNRRSREITGIEEKDVASLKLNLFDNPFFPDDKKEILRRGGNVSFESLYRDTLFSRNFFKSTDGKDKNIFVKSTALLDEQGQTRNYISILSDHTDSMHAYRKLGEFQRMFDQIGEFSEVGFFRINLMSKNLESYATNQWSANLNISPEDITMASGLIPNTIHPEDVAGIAAFMDSAVQGTSMEYSAEVRVMNKHTPIRWVRMAIKVVEYNPKREKVTLFGFNMDISKLKEVEIALLEAKMKAEESDNLKTAFLANMSHEIRTPLNAIVGFSSMIADDPMSPINSELATLINRNNNLLLQIITDVLDLARIEAGIFDAVLSSTDINQLCREVYQSFTGEAKEPVHVYVSGALPVCHMLCDHHRVVQVLNAFMRNALKFTHQGSIELGYLLTDDESHPEIEFYVRDSGIGMSAEQAERCFDRFSKADSFIQGAGLGLCICKELIRRMNGEIGVESQEGVGSRFWFRLPYIPSVDPNEVEDSLSILTSDGRKPVILVAEDMVTNYLLISAMLRQHYTIIVVENGEDAVRVHAEKKPDLILMDLKMPKMDGLEATQLIRKTDTRTPIVAMTAFAFEYDKKMAMDMGCTYVLTKPIDQTRLRKIIRKLVMTGAYQLKEN